ncbi:hypothetical protein M413DRAFT_78129 [Hebeloma cylindrosporum]|uniref:Tc1-like transposase DDE domain-containing protein n=1 Tax=Hebeloma cylindrosporum TaxID=76867 RepID=A0A0C3BIT8_HEBCY|nr:hypothetical protein M413DRAFT_78129 [Hebeloma cylindrosporum h7]
MHYEFLPSYSPDFNPIEPAFSVIKAHIQYDTEVYMKLNEAVWSVTPDDAAGWFRHSGYTV